MVIIRVFDVSRKAYTYEDGLAVFVEVSKFFDMGEKVVISFERIDSIPSSFANGCFVKLLETYGLERIKGCLGVERSTKQINQMIKDRLAFESKRLFVP